MLHTDIITLFLQKVKPKRKIYSKNRFGKTKKTSFVYPWRLWTAGKVGEKLVATNKNKLKKVLCGDFGIEDKKYSRL